MNIALTILCSIPMLGIALLIANIFALIENALDWSLFSITLPSGGEMAVSAGSIVIVLALLTLIFELLKTALGHTRPMRAQIGTVVILIIAVLEWLFIPALAHVSMMILVLMILADLFVELFYPQPIKNKQNDLPKAVAESGTLSQD